MNPHMRSRPHLALTSTHLAISAAVAATAATLAAPALADIDNGDGNGSEYYIQTTGATALGAFTSAQGTSGPFLLGQQSLTIGDTVYTLPTGSAAQAIGALNGNVGGNSSFEPGTNADRIVYSYHETGSVNGIRDLAIRNGLLGGTPPDVNATQPLYVMGQITPSFPAGLTNGYSRYVNSTPDNAPVPGVPGAFYDYNVSAKPIPQISYSDVRFEQAFSLQGAAMLDSRPTEAGYGMGQDPALHGFNAGSPNFQRLADVGGLDGGVASDTTLLRNTAVAVVPFTISANPGTGLDSISEEDARFLQVAGRLQNGANFNSATRDIGSGTRNQGANNLRVDPSWAAGERDRVATGTYQVTDVDGNLVTVNPGDEAKPGVNFATGVGSENPNEARPSLVARYADKDSGGGAQRPTIVSQRMALGVLSVGDVGSRGRSNAVTDPLRVLAIDFEGTDNADMADAPAVQPTADDVASGRYQLWSAAQAVTVRGTLATGATADGQLTGGTLSNDAETIYNDVDDDGSGTGVVNKFLTNITGDASLSNFDGGNVNVQNALTPLDALIAAGFIPTPLMEVTKEFDGDTQSVVGRSDTAEAVFDGAPGDQLRASLNFVRAGDLNGNINAQSYQLFDVGNTSSPRTPVANVSIGFTARTFLAGDMNGDGVRDLEDTEAWAQALADTSAFLAANPSITVGAQGVQENNSSGGDLDISGMTNQQLALVALSDLNGDGNVVAVGAPGTAGGVDQVAAISREDVRYFLYGASVDTRSANAATGYAGSSNAQTRRELGVRLGALKKNEAIDRFNAAIDANGGAASLKFDKFDVNMNGGPGLSVAGLDDARVVDRNVGRDYTNLGDVISTADDLIAAELNDNRVITHVSGGSGTTNSDFELIYQELRSDGRLTAGDVNLDGNVSGQDLTTVVGRLGTSVNRYTQGDVFFNPSEGFDGNVTGSDLSTVVGNFGTGGAAGGALFITAPGDFDGDGDGIAEFLYDPASGEVILVPDGDDIASFALLADLTQIAGFDPSEFIVPKDDDGDDFGFVTATQAELGATAGDFTNGFTLSMSIGNVLPTGLGLADLELALGNSFYTAGFGAGTPNFEFALVPEPSSLALAGIAGLGLLRRRRHA